MSKRLPKVLLSQLKAEASEDPPVKITKRNPKKVVPGICDLPSELLQIIFGNINTCHHNCIRAASKQLRDVSDMFAMHEFRKALFRHKNYGYESAAMKVIEYATEVYVHSGFGSTFCGCILPMLRNSQEHPLLYPLIRQIEKFLMHFYGMVDKLPREKCTQRSRLLHTLTLMRFFTKFDKSIISSNMMPLYWRVTIELKGFWLGTLWTPKVYQRAKRSNILVILSQMLLAKITGKDFINDLKILNETYVFGNFRICSRRNDKRLPKTFFTITVHGSNRICLLFRSCLEDSSDQFTWPSEWPKDQFTVNLDILCHEATNWDCKKRMKFGPFT